MKRREERGKRNEKWGRKIIPLKHMQAIRDSSIYLNNKLQIICL